MDINGRTPAGSISNSRFERTGVAGTMARSYDYIPSTALASPAGTVSSKYSMSWDSTGYCSACFHESGRVSLDADGRCPKHGGKTGQLLGLTKVDQAVLGIGAGVAAAYLLAALWGPVGSKR